MKKVIFWKSNTMFRHHPRTSFMVGAKARKSRPLKIS
nr:MAG TPA: hypothetical protein [Bacteriophage sp.]